MMDATCQRCLKRDFHWCVSQAEFTVGTVKGWKVQLCRECTEAVESALMRAMEHRAKGASFTGDPLGDGSVGAALDPVEGISTD